MTSASCSGRAKLLNTEWALMRKHELLIFSLLWRHNYNYF